MQIKVYNSQMGCLLKGINGTIIIKISKMEILSLGPSFHFWQAFEVRWEGSSSYRSLVVTCSIGSRGKATASSLISGGLAIFKKVSD